MKGLPPVHLYELEHPAQKRSALAFLPEAYVRIIGTPEGFLNILNHKAIVTILGLWDFR